MPSVVADLVDVMLLRGGGFNENGGSLPSPRGLRGGSLDTLGDSIGEGRPLKESPGDTGGTPGAGPGDRGAMIPSVSRLRGLSRRLGIELKGKISRSDLNRDDRGRVVVGFEGLVGVPGSPVIVGKALSFALKLRNKKSGASHTQMPKNVAISAKPWTGSEGEDPE